MERLLTTVAIRLEQDVVLARQRARQLASALAFDPHDQVRLATAVSEIARNAFRYAGKGKVEFRLSPGPPPSLRVLVSDSGPGIAHLQDVLNGRYVSRTGLGMGILGARRLMDVFEIQSGPTGTSVVLGKHLPKRAPPVSAELAATVAAALASQPAQNPLEELQRQNQDLLAALDELQRRQAELAALNRELEDTNRGVVALYAELDERADFLRRASELKTQFLSNMTHEFRTPVNSIISLSGLLLDHIDGPLSPEQDRQVKFILNAANGLSDLVNDLLDLAKVEAGKISIHPADFSVRELFGALRGMLRPLLSHNSSVNLIFEEPEHLPPLHSDEAKISQILRNLISNALKFTERGEIRVIAAAEQPGWVSFAVADTGIGISPDDQERIFEEFIQIQNPLQAKRPGTGLGLPLSRKFAELLGGSLTLKSEPGLGSTFTLRLPLRLEGSLQVSAAPEVPAELDPARSPVLIVEDNPETLFTYQKYLKGSRFQPIPARTLDDARRALEQFRPAAVVLDILLAHESTWSFIAELKRAENTASIPLIVVTMVVNQQKAFALGANAFHLKPIDRAWLLERLSSLAPPVHGNPNPLPAPTQLSHG